MSRAPCSSNAILLRYAPSVILLPITAEFRGLLFALLGLTTLIGGPDFCPTDPRECLDIFVVVMLWETSASNDSTVAYPIGCDVQFVVFILCGEIDERVNNENHT